MIVGKLMKPVLQNQIADKTPNPNLVGGDIMDFNKIVKRNTRFIILTYIFFYCFGFSTSNIAKKKCMLIL